MTLLRTAWNSIAVCIALSVLIRPNNSRAQDPRELRDPDLEISRCTEAIRANPRDVGAYVARGIAWARKNDHARAIDDYGKALAMEGRSATIYFDRGNSWMALSRYDDAIRDYTAALSLDPWDADALENRAIVWTSKGEYDRALADFNKSLRLVPRDPDRLCNRGNLWRKKQDDRRAISDYTRAIEIDPAHYKSHLNRGVSWDNLKEYEKAISDYSRAIQLDPLQTAPYLNLAMIWSSCPEKRLRDSKKAIDSAMRACQLTHWKQPDQLDILASAYAEAGDFEHAAAVQERANEFFSDPEDRQDGERILMLYRRNQPDRDDTGAPNEK